MSCLYIFDITPLYVALLEEIFSHSVGCLFVFLMISFAVQKLLSLLGPIGFFFVSLLSLFLEVDQTRC